MTTPTARRLLDVVARRQHSLFTLRQSLDAGFTRPAVSRRLASGEWETVARHVMRALPAGPLTWRQRLLARTIASRGVASHTSAAALYGWLPESEPLHVTVLRSARSASNSDAHSTLCLPSDDLTIVDGIAATRPVRTLLDLGGQLDLDEFEVVFDAALVGRAVAPSRLARRAVELWAPRRSGCAQVLRLLEQRGQQLPDVRNVWEARVLREMRANRLPVPRCNFPVLVGGARRVIDFAWPELLVAVEFDGFVPHSGRRVFDDDRVRQNDLVDAGWRVYRLTSTALTGDPRVALRPIARAVGLDW
jgi:very-short-patch-repair endonuclease